MPSRKRRSSDAPFASGVASVTVPDDNDELKPPPFGCDGGCSSVVPLTERHSSNLHHNQMVVASTRRCHPAQSRSLLRSQTARRSICASCLAFNKRVALSFILMSKLFRNRWGNLTNQRGAHRASLFL